MIESTESCGIVIIRALPVLVLYTESGRIGSDKTSLLTITGLYS